MLFSTPHRPISAYLLFHPPRRRWQGPIVDAHMHANDVRLLRSYYAVAELYDVRYTVPITSLESAIKMRQEFGDRVCPAVWGIAPKRDRFHDLAQFRRDKTALLESMAAHGLQIVKLWFTPRFLEWSNLRLDDPALDFFFDRIRDLKLTILLHTADPDTWFRRQLRDLDQHGGKDEHLLQLTTRLDQYPEVLFQGAHFSSLPEDLDHLADLLDRYPNYVVDSSATKWVAREFSKHGAAARDFLTRHADRVLFGTDLVADPEWTREGKGEFYATRFYVHQRMWEQDGLFESPIEDEDCAGPPSFQGLGLPPEVLAKFYWGNAARLYGFTQVPVHDPGL
jgi:predicted TIM-barrel fold metal-dependent hydrolase